MVLPGGATLVDHGAGADRPPWRTDDVDDQHLCAVEVGGRRARGRGLHSSTSQLNLSRL